MESMTANNSLKKILVVDDEPSVQESLRTILKDNYQILSAMDGVQAIEVFHEQNPHLLLLDIAMTSLNGLEVLRKIRESNVSLPVIMITATNMVKTAVQAMKLGATDYLTKPFDIEELKLVIQKAVSTSDLESEVKLLRSEVQKRYSFNNIIGKSRAMQEIYNRIEQVADTKSTVLITGESGTGKELVARALHYRSTRRNKPFIAINCAAIPEGLIESELFGHERGAFTDASSRRIGQFELAHEGTLFLDEISDLSPATQAKLLRVLQEKEFTRLGAARPIRVDVRLVTASNKDLQDVIQKGLFREDLYYRINVVSFYLPPLRQRKEDVPLLIKHFLTKKAEESDLRLKECSKDALVLLMQYDWPGNVRELENIIEQAITLSNERVISSNDLPAQIKNQALRGALQEQTAIGNLSFKQALIEFEKELILSALEKSADIQTRAAQLLGISRRILRYKMHTLGLLKKDRLTPAAKTK
jgi:two-component system response regulator AtoC